MHGASVDSGVPNGAILVRFVEAALADPLGGGGGDLARARETVRQTLGDAAFVDVCATIASFNAVVKLADGTSIPLETAKAERTADIRASLAIDAMRS